MQKTRGAPLARTPTISYRRVSWKLICRLQLQQSKSERKSKQAWRVGAAARATRPPAEPALPSKQSQGRAPASAGGAPTEQGPPRHPPNPRAMPRTSRARLTKAGKEKPRKGIAASCVGHVRLSRLAAAPRTSPQQSTRSQPGPGSVKKLQVLARNSVHPRRRLGAYPGARRAPWGVRSPVRRGPLRELPA